MSTDLEIQTNDSLVPMVVSPYEDTFASMSGGKYLPRLQLFGGNSDAVKEAKIPVGNFALVSSKDQFTVLGLQVDILLINWRPKAMSVGGDKVLSYFNPSSIDFQEIQEKSFEKNSGCMFGPEFLVWVPEHERFATLLMGSKTGRREAPNLKSLLGKPATIKAQYIKTKQYSWHGIISQPCTTPFDVPTKEQILQVLDEFLHPQESVVEEITPSEASSERED